ncbi:MAG: hypothetical protein OQK49_07730 [Proteobacteria bacterium]|nr:hypothetical protein [Pseudomonadota bacterium]
MSKSRKIILISLIIGFLVVLTYRLVMFYLPDNINPLKPLRIDHQPTFLIKSKINRLKSNLSDCFGVLDNSDLEFERIDDKSTGENCGFKGVAMLRQSGISYGGDIVLKCPALVALATCSVLNLCVL